jgi:hypothetical protein
MYQIGGSIPNFLSERQMPKQLAEVRASSSGRWERVLIWEQRVAQVLEYMDARRQGQSGRKPKLVSRSSSLSLITGARKRSVQALSNPGAGSSSSTPAGSTIATAATAENAPEGGSPSAGGASPASQP